MKQKLLSALVVAAVAGMAVNANAGVIQSSYKNYAAEVFGDNTVVLTAPTIGYALALPLTGTQANPNSFTISWTLSGGATWNAAPAAATIVLAQPDGTVPVAGPTTYQVAAPTLSADKTTLTAVITVSSNFTTGSQVVLGGGGAVQVTKVGTTLGAPALSTDGCSDAVASVNVTAKLTNAAGTEFDSNFTLAPLLNTTPIVQSRRALEVLALSSSAFPRTTLGAVDTDIEQSRVDVLQPSGGKLFLNNPVDITNSTTVLNLGQVIVRDRSVLFDLNGTNAYSVGTAAFGTNPASAVGIVEANGITFKVSGKFATGATVTVARNSIAATGETVVGAAIASTTTFNADRTEATVTVAAGDLTDANFTQDGNGATATARRLNVLYTVPGTSAVPVTQFKLVSGQLNKFASSLEAPNVACPGNLYNLIANGVQVDVRNYVPDVAAAPSGGWKSIVRIINTDESQTADVNATVLHRNGDLGASALLVTLKPREVVYLQSAQIDAKLNAAATATATSFGADDIGQNARLRLTAANSSIRVQNYLFNPANGNFIEGSSAQGDEGPALAVRDSVNK
ncbi:MULTISPECIES: hypothetical protein [unclassified Roseateles]|uniref:hypothetical protein n=1 Tax=unclassified Roseateles TaxID=2626991 RepID=UPI0006F2EFA3|nr:MULTISPECIES: hypothetical protein [unclassified Roseateles]KQW42096.1 hypothetical protein ASC81_22610 [Pelomonas sp. Root405]KRA67699.1 hypothetical protein ASD88_24195 [Pelomonas sp. Root662]